MYQTPLSCTHCQTTIAFGTRACPHCAAQIVYGTTGREFIGSVLLGMCATTGLLAVLETAVSIRLGIWVDILALICGALTGIIANYRIYDHKVRFVQAGPGATRP